MLLHMLKAKIHRITVTDANLNYNGSITIDKEVCIKAGIKPNEKVDIYNCNSGSRIATYVIYGDKGQVCLNGAAARHCQPGDEVIIACYVYMSEDEVKNHSPVVLFKKDF